MKIGLGTIDVSSAEIKALRAEALMTGNPPWGRARIIKVIVAAGMAALSELAVDAATILVDARAEAAQLRAEKATQDAESRRAHLLHVIEKAQSELDQMELPLGSEPVVA